MMNWTKPFLTLCTSVLLFGSNHVFAQEVPQKIITMGPNATEMVVALGASDSIIGTTLTNHSRGPLEQYAEIYKNLPELAYASASREAVLTSGADFVFTIDWEIGPAGLNQEELEAAGMQVMIEEAKTLEALYQEISQLGNLLDRTSQAETLISSIKADIESVNLSQSSPKTILVYDSGDQGVFTAGGKNFATRLIEAAGGKNIFDDIMEKEWITVANEEVITRNPDYLMILDYDQPDLETKIKNLKADPILSQLDAVKEEKFIVLPLEAVLPGVRAGMTVKTIAETIAD